MSKQTTHDRMNQAIYEAAKGLYDIDAIDSITMREFDSLKLPEVKEMSSRQIKSLRLKERVSQAVFAKFLNTSVHTIRDWEQGKKHPRGATLRLLALIENKGLSALV